MRRLFRTLALAAAALVAAVALFVGATLPPAARVLPGSLPATVRLGAYHVHTSRSDGTGSVDQVAEAAAKAGLHFVVLADHGDGTRAPDRPQYLHGVLVIDAVEVSTDDGHLVALGLFGPAPYPIAGAAGDVIEDVHRLGGLAVIAHPDSPKTDLRWLGRGGLHDGFEWVNADTEWRDDPPMRLVGAALRGLVRGPESVVSLFSRRDGAFARWDGSGPAARPRRAFGVAALDAHARVGWDENTRDEPRQRTALAIPGYELMFRVFAQAVEVDEPLTGAAMDDATRVLAALSSGRTYTLVRAIGGPATLSFGAEQGGRLVAMGGDLNAGPATFRAEIPGVDDAVLTVIKNGERVATGRGRVEYEGTAAEGNAFRVEAALGDSPFPWIVSNPIYTRSEAAPRPEVPAADVAAPSDIQPIPVSANWQIERDASSTANQRIDTEAGTIVLQYALAPGRPAGQFVALSLPVESESGYESVRFEARASRPMRLSFQVRLPGPADGQRWGRSVYVDETPRVVVLRLEELRPIGRTSTLRPVVSRIRSLLFVIDTVNTLPGTAGELQLSHVVLGLGSTGPGG